jgi:predicted RNA binding protein YcfA (HicA-like mRNA interferase family)
VDFADLIRLLRALGFSEIGGQGSHRVYARTGIAETLTLQEAHGQAKPYQVRQVVALVRQYDLEVEGEK